MIGRARTNLRAEIEDQYEILSFLVSDISSHYQEQVDDVEEKVAEFKKVNANEDYEIVSSELRNFYAASEICDSRCVQSRQILFCAIFARHIETTKRYVFLVIGNVRNFQSQQESVAVRAYSVDWLLHLLTR